MKYAIIYSSTTGNTKMLAEALAMHMKETDCVLCETEHADAINADFYFVGFWTFRGKCDKNTQQFLEKLEHKYIFLFGTAGFVEKSRRVQNVNTQNLQLMRPGLWRPDDT